MAPPFARAGPARGRPCARQEPQAPARRLAAAMK